MDDNTSKSSSSLVVAEKNAHKPGGCVGIFWKLFEWNRTFAKKNLFPKKLLAPARGNKLSKKLKLNADQNVLKGKHFLTRDVNGGAIPKKNVSVGKHEMKSPGLVAKLMGLESMPIVNPKSSENAPFSENGNWKNVGFVEGSSDKEFANLEKGRLSNGFQPQKGQKTSLFEKRPVNRFGADALQIRSVLSRSKKRHSKLASPVKSPRAAKSSSRLIDAATRILEPGLHATSRVKCALTYPSSMPAQSSSIVAKHQDLKAQSSCRNCGHALEGMDFTTDAIEQNPRLDMPASSTHEAFFDTVEERKQSVATWCDKESEVVLLRSGYHHPPKDLKDQGKAISGAQQHETSLQAMQNGKKHWGTHDNSFIPHQVHSDPEMLIRDDRIPQRSTMTKMHNRRVSSTTAFDDKKDFMAMNRNVSQAQFRIPRKLDDCAELRRKYRFSQDGALSTERSILTRRNAGFCRHVDCSSSSSLVMDRERGLESRLMAGRMPGFGCNLAYPNCAKSQPFARSGNVANRREGTDDVSLSFNSLLESMSRSFCRTEMNHMRIDRSNCMDDTSRERFIREGSHGVKSVSPLLMNEDALGTLLAQKLKELTSQGENESAAVTPQVRNATAILLELISALTAERSISPELRDSLSSGAARMYRPSQADARGKSLPMRFCGNHFSPGSVLDASFSNDSCVSSSIDESSGTMLQYDLMDVPHDDLQLVHSDRYFCNPESSFNSRETSSNIPARHLLNRISRVLDRTNLPDTKLSTTYSTDTKEVLINAELLFGNSDRSETLVDFLVGPFIDELETLAVAAWRNTIISGFQLSKGGNANPLRRFLFDCLIECLSTRYDRYNNSGFNEWCRLPRHLNVEALIGLFDFEVRKSASLARMTLDELIDWEMNASLSKWTDFEAEMFQTGAEIGLILFQGLVEEIIAEFMV